jgi:putative DNA primase/helicase
MMANEAPFLMSPAMEGPRQGTLATVLRLAGRGFRLFPVEAWGKKPLIREWPEKSTCEAEILSEWHCQHPGCNWGLACGPDSGVFVLDVDGDEGAAAVRELCTKFGASWLSTLAATTARGRHLYFQFPQGAEIRNSASKLAPGLDIRGDGGYAVIPPSIHSTGAAYAWVNEDVPIAQPPSWLVEILSIPNQPISVSAVNADAIAEGQRNATLASLAGTMQRRGMSVGAIEVALLAENAARCNPPLEKAEVLQIASSVRRYAPSSPAAPQTHSDVAADDWQQPEPLGGELPSVQSCNIDMVPEVVRALVEDTAERMQVPLDFPAAVTVLALAGVTNRRATIQPKASDTSWVVVPNLWGGIVAPPGLLKSPVISTITRPVTQIEALWRANYESKVSEYKFMKEEAELRRAAWREQFKAAQKGVKEAPIRPDDSFAEPKPRRLITQDATAEKLHEILRDNPEGVLVIRDELSGWIAVLDKPGREGERGFFLSAWNGDTGYTMDRIGRGSIHVDACCVSMLGGIQPARLRAYLVDALADGPSNDGLLQRFQVLVYPDLPGSWRYVDRPPHSGALARAERLYQTIAHWDASHPVKLAFAPDAQELFIAFLTELEGKLRSNELHPSLMSHLAKFRSLMPSLALLFELADGGTETVSLAHARQAAAYCEYLESHARRCYSMIILPERQAASELARHLAAGWKRSERTFTVRDVYQNDWRGLQTPDAVRRALAILEDAGWVRLMPSQTNAAGGRRSEIYTTNPKVWRTQ